MAIALISSWFKNGCEYSSGVALYLRFGKSETLKKLFRGPQTIFTERKLREALDELNDQTPKKLKPEPNPKPSTPKKEREAPFRNFSKHKQLKYDTSNFPEDLRKLDIQKGELYAKAAFLKSRLSLIKNPEEGMKALAEIKWIMRDKVPSIWEQLDFFHLTGERLYPTGEKQEEETNLPELIKKRNNARTKVSRYKKLEGKEQLLQKWTAKLERLEHQIERFEA